LWSGSTTPTVTDYADAQAVELGVQFSSSVNGYVTGVRFYKGVDNTGEHIGSLWTSGGALLAQVFSPSPARVAGLASGPVAMAAPVRRQLPHQHRHFVSTPLLRRPRLLNARSWHGRRYCRERLFGAPTPTSDRTFNGNNHGRRDLPAQPTPVSTRSVPSRLDACGHPAADRHRGFSEVRRRTSRPRPPTSSNLVGGPPAGAVGERNGRPLTAIDGTSGHTTVSVPPRSRPSGSTRRRAQPGQTQLKATARPTDARRSR
jgi:hypothetical protein